MSISWYELLQVLLTTAAWPAARSGFSAGPPQQAGSGLDLLLQETPQTPLLVWLELQAQGESHHLRLESPPH